MGSQIQNTLNVSQTSIEFEKNPIKIFNKIKINEIVAKHCVDNLN